MSDRKPVMKRKPVATRAAAKAEPIDLVETSFAEVVGLIGVLVTARNRHLINSLGPLLDELENTAGFRLSKDLKQRVLAEEQDSQK